MSWGERVGVVEIKETKEAKHRTRRRDRKDRRDRSDGRHKRDRRDRKERNDIRKKPIGRRMDLVKSCKLERSKHTNTFQILCQREKETKKEFKQTCEF